MKDLIQWKDGNIRKPLILKGVRQCGKTYLLKYFAEKYFPDVAYFNFEFQEILKSVFDQDLDVERIVTELGVHRKKPILKDTLIIFDEIQFCPKAVTSLKYFAEIQPDQAIVCAGSLLGIALSKPTSFPVGKVDFLTLYPMNFEEFLLANNEELLVEYLRKLSPKKSVTEVFKNKLNIYLKSFLITGGMPEVVAQWIKDKDLEQIEKIQQNIISSYEFDFNKHAPLHDIPKLSLLWRSIPEQLSKENKKFIYGNVQKGFRAKDLENALQWLIDVGLAYKVIKITEPSIPISAYADYSFFKLYLFDVGLLRKMSGLEAEEILKSDNKDFREFKGSLMENFVLSELISCYNTKPYFWKSGNTAEIDFVVQMGKYIVPIEVKSGKNTKAKSLAEYIKKYQPKIAIITSNKDVRKTKSEPSKYLNTKLKNVPLSLIWKLKDYIGVE